MSPDPGGVLHLDGNLFPNIPGTPSTGGVALNAPPAHLLADTTKFVREAMAEVPDGEHLVAVANVSQYSGKTNVNLALAVKAGTHVDVVTWIGKSWGAPVSAGVLGRVHF